MFARADALTGGRLWNRRNGLPKRQLDDPASLCDPLAAALSLGCDNKETVLDVKGPRGGSVEVERDKDTGAVDVDVQDDDDLVDVEREPDGGIDVDVNAK